MSLAAVVEAAKAYFSEGMNPAHDWHHVERVDANADRLRSEYQAVDDFVVRASVYLHDIGREREDTGEITDHAEWGARESETILREHGVAAERVSAISHAIRAHRFSRGPEPESLEAKILSDADNLDALGAVGIARCFTQGGDRGSPIHDPDLPPKADETEAGATQYNHFYKKLLDLPARMYTQTGREIAEDRREFMKQFLTRFDDEIAGDR
ncbi:MAG: HD domain-containing protein [Halodesulfurarchaeum sp.]|nr:HD domain-containing protein [Halodesulfurarchaeum sp.]